MSNTNILDKLNKLLIEAQTSRTAYRTKYQEYLEVFFDNYDKTLSKNSEPLFKFLKTLDNTERVKVNLYILKNTTVAGVTVSDKGCKIKLKDGEDSLAILDKNIKWYDMKVEVKPFEPTKEKLKQSLARLLKNYSKDLIKDCLKDL